MEIKKCENCGSEHIHVITKEIGYSCLKCGRNTVRLNEMHQTNADRIRSFSDEELAEFLVKVNTAYAEPCMISGGDCKWEDYPTHDKGCKDCFKEWIQSEVEV